MKSLLARTISCIMVCLCVSPSWAADMPTTTTNAFPVTIDHRYGSTRVPAQPKRVVSLSFIGHDFLLALGVKPIALRDWYGGHKYGVWPWAQDALGDAEPLVMRGAIDIELIATLKPDLIVGQWSGMTDREYALLSRIAPTLPAAGGIGDYDMSWQDMLLALGQVTGTTAKATAEVARLNGRFQQIKDTHPDWQGQTAVMVWAGTSGAYTDNDLRGQFLTQMGFKIPPALTARSSLNNNYVLVPDEAPEWMDADVLIWLDAGQSIDRVKALPLRHTMRAYKEGREIYSGLDLSAALSHSSPLSLDYALDTLVPLIAAAIDGDPTTPVATSVAAGLAKGGEQ